MTKSLQRPTFKGRPPVHQPSARQCGARAPTSRVQDGYGRNQRVTAQQSAPQRRLFGTQALERLPAAPRVTPEVPLAFGGCATAKERMSMLLHACSRLCEAYQELLKLESPTREELAQRHFIEARNRSNLPISHLRWPCYPCSSKMAQGLCPVFRQQGRKASGRMPYLEHVLGGAVSGLPSILSIFQSPLRPSSALVQARFRFHGPARP